MKYSLGLLVLLSGLAFSSAAPSGQSSRSVTLTVRTATITAELAQTPEELSRGLMYRESLGDNAGMLFVLREPQQAVFWMKNTPLPLSIAYLNSHGQILEIYDMSPFSEVQVSSKSDKVRFALEMNQGWFALNKIVPLDVILPKETSWEKLATPIKR
jgi:uncharacterized membrane protein (UPF0127 family)